VSNPVVLSASSVQTFLRCGQQWFFAYVAGVKSPPTLKQARGIAVHKAVEVNMLQKLTTRVDLPVDDVADAYVTAYDEMSPEIEEDKHKVGEYKDTGVQLVKLHTKVIAPEIQPKWVEQPIQFSLNGIPFSGQVDLLDEMDRVRDTKTTAQKPRGESYILNMTGYALAYRQLTGQVETDTILDYLVATKKPYYIPVVAGGPVDDNQIIRFANVVESVHGAIEAGRFVPNGLTSGACDWCGFRNICPAYERRALIELE
jgi:RecB family exonuclease